MIPQGIHLTAIYDYRLVTLSIAIAVFGSYIGLDLAEQVIRSQGWARKLWLTGGTVALGISIWAMHFIAMLAYQLAIPIVYDFVIVLTSLAVAIAGAGAGLFVVSRKQPLGWLPLLSGALFVGMGTVGLHLTAMASIRVAAVSFYNPVLMGVSMATAIAGSGMALWLGFHSRSERLWIEIGRRVGSVVAMATAIVGMHYLAMAAVSFWQTDEVTVPSSTALDNSRLAVFMGVATLAILVLTLLASFFGQRASANRAAAQAKRQEEERLRSLVYNASDIIAIVAESGTISYLSQSIDHILGYKPEEWLGRKTCEAIHPDDLARGKSFWHSVCQTDDDRKEEVRLRGADGTWYDFEVIAKNLLANPAITGIVVTCRDITERKRQEAQLRQSEQQYQQLYDHAPDAYFSVTPDGMIKAANQYGAEYLGYSKEELIGKPALMTIYEPDRKQAQQWLNDIFTNQLEQRENEVRKLCKNGSYIWVRDRTQLLLNEEGTPTEVHIICRNITERKQAEQALQESEAKFRSLIQNSSDLIVLLDRNRIIQYASPSHARILGCRPRELIGKEFLEFVHPDDSRSTLNAFDELLETRSRRLGVELRVRVQDGSWCYLESIGNNLLDELAVAAIVVNSRDITERKQAETQLFQNAFYDPLTGLPNRSFFMNRLEHALEYSLRHQDYLFAVLFLDLDRFKIINDSLGHSFGDRLLVAIAAQLKSCIRPTDTAARLGGDEFTVLLEGIENESDAIRVANRIQEELKSPFKLSEQEVFTGTSIGIALSEAGYSRAEDILRDADLAMYRAKELGRSRYEMFNASMLDRAVTRLQLETDLRRAIELQEFQVYYQPLVSLEGGNLIGFEALIRWEHPQHGLLNPEAFISVAEETGLMSRIDRWLLRQACDQTRQWQQFFSDSGQAANLVISVNLCGYQFSQPDLSAYINDTLQETHLAAQSLNLEITENIIMANGASATQTLSQLRNLGVQLSIDDFGTGYSSLGRLHRFPIDGLKIDRSFVNGIDNNDKNLEIIESIVTLAQKLGVSVTAEGVETEAQLIKFRELKCDYGQGSFFSTPLDAQAAAALIALNPRW